jgi:GT2 family glycosyltransferase
MNISSEEAVDVTISIASYNTRELLRDCLDSLLALRDEVGLQIIVADNGSRDGTIEMLKNEYSNDVQLIETGGNLGYGRANNKAFEYSNGRYFLALNSDTTIPSDTLKNLVEFMDAHPEAGACGAQLLNTDGSNQTSWGCDTTWRGILEEQTGILKLRTLLTRTSSGDEEKSDADTEPREVEQICGAAQLVRREAWAQVSGYDPKYFMYHEDVDLNIRIRRAGWKIYLVPAAKVFHHLGASSERSWQSRARMVSALNKSRYYAFSQHEGRLRGEVLKVVFIGGALLRLLHWTLRVLVRPNTLHRERVRLFREVLRQTTRADRDDPRR